MIWTVEMEEARYGAMGKGEPFTSMVVETPRNGDSLRNRRYRLSESHGRGVDNQAQGRKVYDTEASVRRKCKERRANISEEKTQTPETESEAHILALERKSKPGNDGAVAGDPYTYLERKVVPCDVHLIEHEQQRQPRLV